WSRACQCTSLTNRSMRSTIRRRWASACPQSRGRCTPALSICLRVFRSSRRRVAEGGTRSSTLTIAGPSIPIRGPFAMPSSRFVTKRFLATSYAGARSNGLRPSASEVYVTSTRCWLATAQGSKPRRSGRPKDARPRSPGSRFDPISRISSRSSLNRLPTHPEASKDRRKSLRRRQSLASVALEACDKRVGRHHVAEGQIEIGERGVVVLVGHGGIGVGHHDGLEIA